MKFVSRSIMQRFEKNAVGQKTVQVNFPHGVIIEKITAIENRTVK
jgi:hypothetical protein